MIHLRIDGELDLCGRWFLLVMAPGFIIFENIQIENNPIENPSAME